MTTHRQLNTALSTLTVRTLTVPGLLIAGLLAGAAAQAEPYRSIRYYETKPYENTQPLPWRVWDPKAVDDGLNGYNYRKVKEVPLSASARRTLYSGQTVVIDSHTAGTTAANTAPVALYQLNE